MNDFGSDPPEAPVPDVQKSEEDLRQALSDLQTVVQKKFDLGERINESPLAWLGAAFLVGFWLGSRDR